MLSEKQKKHLRDRMRLSRRKIVELYGGRCSKCGESKYGYLTIHHLNGGGVKHRKQTHCGYGNYRAILLEGYRPDKYSILCYNCHFGTGE